MQVAANVTQTLLNLDGTNGGGSDDKNCVDNKATFEETESKFTEAMELLKNQASLEDAMKKFVKMMVTNFKQTFGDSFGKIKASLLKAAKKQANKRFNDGYKQMKKYSWPRMFWKVVVELDYLKLNKQTQ